MTAQTTKPSSNPVCNGISYVVFREREREREREERMLDNQTSKCNAISCTESGHSLSYPLILNPITVLIENFGIFKSNFVKTSGRHGFILMFTVHTLIL